MPLFKKQAGYCTVCGHYGDYNYLMDRLVTCSKECYLEAEWRSTLYIRGQAYYPKAFVTEKAS